jgi:hypothetical protein
VEVALLGLLADELDALAVHQQARNDSASEHPLLPMSAPRNLLATS